MNCSWVSLAAIPIIGAFIGWVTNWVAVKMLFHPREERRWLGIRVQGVFPRRQKVLAASLGEVVSEKLFSMEEIKGRINQESIAEEARKVLDEHLDKVLWERIPQAVPMLAMFMTPALAKTIKGALEKDIDGLVSTMLDSVGNKLGEVVDIQAIVREKVESLSSDRVEELLKGIMQKEFVFIEIVGGVLGFLIGIVQVLISRIPV